jgi:adenylate cyclase
MRTRIAAAAAISLITAVIVVQFRACDDAACASEEPSLIHFSTAARERAKAKRALELKLSPKTLKRVTRNPEVLKLSSATRVMSFLACRIRGFDAIADSLDRDPGGLTKLTRCTLTPLTQAVLDRQGTIDRMTPDGFTAFFNAPLDDSQHASHACECGLAMMQGLEKANRRLEHATFDGVPMGPVGIGIGISTGPGIVGDFGTDRQPHFTVAGRASLHASELERQSGEYGTSILVAESTRGMAENEFAFLEVDAVETKSGEREPLYALVGTPVSRANPKFLALKAFHERIFEAYRAREWSKARELVEQCRGLSGANPVLYDLYLKRIAHLESHPSGADWASRFEPAPA